MISNVLKSFFILILQEEIEEEIRSKYSCYDIINLLQSCRYGHIKRYKKDCCHARISNDNQIESIEKCFPLGILADDEVFRLNVVSEAPLSDDFLDFAHVFILHSLVMLIRGLVGEIMLEEELGLIRFLNHTFNVFDSIK